MVVEIIAGVIVLILAIIGIAKLAQRRGGPGGGAISREDLSKIDVYKNVDGAEDILRALYFIANTRDPKKASSYAKTLFQAVDKNRDEFYKTMEILGYKKDLVEKELNTLKKRYQQFFDEEIAKPRIEAINKYGRQKTILYTALSETREAKASWYAHWSKAISGKQAIEDTRKVLEYHREGYELQKLANKRMAQAKIAREATKQAREAG